MSELVNGISPPAPLINSQKTNKSKLRQLFTKKSLNESSVADKHQPTRQIIVDPSILPKLPEKNQHFGTNRISTTKYNWFNFFPKSLSVQFLRASNVYFLITTILLFIPGFAVLPPYSSVGPLIFVLGMSMMREAYEDYKRRRNDNITNDQKCKVMRKGQHLNNDAQIVQGQVDHQNFCKYENMFTEIKWSDLKCGDILFIQEGEYFPADVALLISSSKNDECFVQTSSLDGERALKHKQCLAPIKHAIVTRGLDKFQSFIHTEPPSKDLYAFKGYIESTQFPEKNTILLSPDSNLRTISLDNKQMALRGSNLANTKWIIGVVLYTGKQSKLMMNQGMYRFKQSKIEKLVNAIVIYLIILQAILCLLMALFSGFYISNYAALNSSQVQRKAEYIFFTARTFNSTSGQLQEEKDTQINYTPSIEGAKTYAQYYILLNTVIPISLVVSIEFVKLIQTPFLQHDVQMYDPESMKQCTPLSLTLHEELGFINYVFADKTGTLTSNIMEFMACSVGSVCYDQDYREEDYDYEVDVATLGQRTITQDDIGFFLQEEQKEEQKEDQDFQDVDDAKSKADEFEQIKSEQGYPFNKKGGKSRMNRRNSATDIVWNYDQSTAIIRGLLEQKKYFFNEEVNLGKSELKGKPLVLRKQNEYLRQFWLNVTLCHDVIATKHETTGQLAYQGTSPDEITLLDAAKEIGFIFANRDSESITIEIFGEPKTFYIRQKIEFTSDRKKMTVIVEDPESDLLLLYCKGADFAIFERLSMTLEQYFLESTKEDLIKFSTKGYRTLCFAMRVLSKEYYNDWVQRYEQAKLEQIKFGMKGNKKELVDEKGRQIVEVSILEQLQNELETELFLLGATALEDKLQEGVPEVIDDFHNAGIKVWMLTGDKLETAENIGFSSKMFNEKMYIFKLQTKEKDLTKRRLKLIEEKIVEIEGQHTCPIIGTMFVLNPNAGVELPEQLIQENLRNTYDSHEAKNIIKALEEYKHETIGSQYTLNESWARKPLFRRKIRKRIEEIAPDKAHIIDRVVKENQFFKHHKHSQKYIPSAFDMKAKQYIIRRNNVYRSTNASTQKQSSTTIMDNEDTFGIIIEGQTLHHITDSPALKKKFLKILGKCQAVIVCRASPSQKAIVVQMVKDNEPLAITLAIGDGANDVNMIQKAHIGIGLFGKEGYQAAGSADYAIGQFRFLRRLMFVHGSWNGIRLSNFVLFFFHKNLIFTLPQFWFGWNSGFSGQTLWNDAYLTMFNTMITAFALGDYAIWEQDLNYNDPAKSLLIELFFPFIYKNSQSDMFTKTKFFVWFGISVLQSLMIYGIPTLVLNNYLYPSGKTSDLWAISLCAYFTLVHLHYMMVIIFTRNWTWWTCMWYVASYLFFNPLFLFIYDRTVDNSVISGRLVEIAFSNGIFWLVSMITLAVTVLPIYFYFTIQSLLFPNLKDLIIQDKVDFKSVMKEADPRKLKATQDLFKQSQHQQQLIWQLEYQQNFQPIVQKLDSNNFEDLTPIQQRVDKKEEGMEMIALPRNIKEIQLPRKGLQSARQIGDLMRQLSDQDKQFGTEQQQILRMSEMDQQFESLEQSQNEESENFIVDDSLEQQLSTERNKMENYHFRSKDLASYENKKGNE